MEIHMIDPMPRLDELMKDDIATSLENDRTQHPEDVAHEVVATLVANQSNHVLAAALYHDLALGITDHATNNIWAVIARNLQERLEPWAEKYAKQYAEQV